MRIIGTIDYAFVMKIHNFLKKHELDHDTRIYWKDEGTGITPTYKCWDYNSNGKKTILRDIKGSTYVEYANDETVTIVYDGGGMYKVMEMNWCSPYYAKLEQEFSDILAKEGYYYEKGNSWNLSLYKI
jgi:hypothetical protein